MLPSNLPRPRLALESTLITHGLPYPENLHTARSLENIARGFGVDPKTIAVVDGVAAIGLDDTLLERLARGIRVLKLSRRDLPVALTSGQTGGTTVSATACLAHAAGIQVFATGGIGGVHRENPRDISADLPELARTRVAVVCAGAKAILDLPATLEFLETWQVPVLGYQTSEFPAFYSRSSGLAVSARVDSPEQAARVIWQHWQTEGSGGVLVAVPIPASDQLATDRLSSWLDQASSELVARQISGPAVTPFLLDRLAKLSGGETVRANMALLRNNVAVASRITLALHSLAGSPT